MSIFNFSFFCNFFAVLCILLYGLKPSPHIFVILLFILFIYYFFKRNKNRALSKLNYNEGLFCISLLLIFITAIPPLLFHESLKYSMRELDVPIKYLYCSLFFYMGFKFTPYFNKHLIYLSVGFSSTLWGLVSLSQFFIFKSSLVGIRVEAFSGINDFGLISSILMLFCIFLYASYARNFIEKLLFFSGAILASQSLLLTSLRGAMLGAFAASIICLILSLILLKNKMQFLKKFIFLIMIILLGIFIVTNISSDKNITRINEISEDITSYQSGNTSTSVGTRLELWKEAFNAFKLSPFIGLSARGIELNKDNIFSERILNYLNDPEESNKYKKGIYFGRKHNEILNQMASRGLLGLIALLILYFSIFKIHLNEIFNNSREAILGLSLLTLYVVAGLTGDLLAAHIESLFFMFFNFLFLMFYKIENK